MLTRTIYGLANQPTAGVAFSAVLDETPSPGDWWEIQHLGVELTNYTSGQVRATLRIGGLIIGGVVSGGRYVGGTNQGQGDTFDAGRTVIRVEPSELVIVTWTPTQTVALVQGKLTASVRQYDAHDRARANRGAWA